MIGLTNALTIVTFHHIWLVFMQSNIDIVFVLMAIFSYIWIWLIFVLEDANPLSPYY